MFPKWRARFPQPPDLVGVTRVYSPDVDEPVLRANQALHRSIPMAHKDGIRENLRAEPVRFLGFKLEGLTPNKTRRAQCANWLLYYRSALWRGRSRSSSPRATATSRPRSRGDPGAASPRASSRARRLGCPQVSRGLGTGVGGSREDAEARGRSASAPSAWDTRATQIMKCGGRSHSPAAPPKWAISGGREGRDYGRTWTKAPRWAWGGGGGGGHGAGMGPSRARQARFGGRGTRRPSWRATGGTLRGETSQNRLDDRDGDEDVHEPEHDEEARGPFALCAATP